MIVIQVFVLIQISLHFTCCRTQQTYKAGVFAHRVIQPTETKIRVSRKVALTNMMKNIAKYKSAASAAQSQGVQILVFPEDGIYGFDYSREGIQPYLEYIPNPKIESWNPCNDPYKYNNTEIQESLSCLASSNNMYIVANMGDNQPCNVKEDRKCPSDGHYQFNTNVVYDPNGTFVARYHKTHLYYENQFNPSPETEYVYFDTPFGRFGVFICFDILFKNPSIDLIEKYNISSISFTAAWWDTVFSSVNLLTAMQFHSAFALGMKVNVLAANIQLPEDGFHGSGIYTPNGYAAFYYNTTPNETKLLVADVRVNKGFTRQYSQLSGKTEEFGYFNKKKSALSQIYSIDRYTKFNLHTKYSADTFQAKLMGDLYTFTILNNSGDMISVCSNHLCCNLDYEVMEGTGKLAVFGAFDGLHTKLANLSIQVCILLECAGDTPESCGQLSYQSSLYFREFRITGNFTSSYVFPEILVSSNGQPSLVSGTLFNFDGRELEIFNGLSSPLLSASLFSRNYSGDNC